MLTEIDVEELPSYHLGLMKGQEKGKAEGNVEGNVEGKLEIVKRMLSIFEDEKIHEYTGVPIREIKRIRKAG